jgi:hypothetical protein
VSEFLTAVKKLKAKTLPASQKDILVRLARAL